MNMIIMFNFIPFCNFAVLLLLLQLLNMTFVLSNLDNFKLKKKMKGMGRGKKTNFALT
jgi:hypothetical protein